jgi:aldehyde:ferredoxin oxidoreductase
MVEMIARRQGIGNLLAEGVRKAAEKLGRGADEFAMHTKGLELPMHEPRLKQGMGLMYAVESVGGDHQAGFQDPMFTDETPQMRHLRGAGAVKPTAVDDLGPAKVANTKAAHCFALFLDSAVRCQFVPWMMHDDVEIIRAATGWDYTVYEAITLGERIENLARIYNYREGITVADDKLPKRFFSGTRQGALKNKGIDAKAFQNAIKTYYAMMGWDEKGKPTQAKLEELGIGWAAQYLK